MPLSRKKSCAKCRTSKARCDQGFPSCERCVDKGFKCNYEGDGPRIAPYPWLPASTASLTGLEVLEEGLDDSMSSSLAYTATLDTAAPMDLETLNWLPSGNSLDFLQSEKPISPSFLDLNTMPKSDSGVSTTSSSSPAFTVPPQPPATAVLETPKNTSLLNLDRAPLQTRPILANSVLSSILVGQITSYPRMLIEGDLLPPFISPPCFIREDLAPDCSENGSHRCLPEDLAVCQGLVRMFFDRTGESAKFVWKSIYDECRRLYRECQNWGSEKQVTAVQALLVYTLLQAHDSYTAEKNGAGELLEMLMDVAARFTDSTVWHTTVPRTRPSRADFVFVESLSRVMMTMSVLDVLLSGIICKSGHAEAGGVCRFPLPCHRDLWLARSNRAWRAAYDREMANRRQMRILTSLDLLHWDGEGVLRGDMAIPGLTSMGHQGGLEAFGKDGAIIGHKGRCNLDEIYDLKRWAEGLDALGTLVWMVVPFQRWRTKEAAAW